MSERLLRAARLVRSFRSGPRAIEVLRGLDLEVLAGESVAIVGDSGVGKSTLLHVLGGLDRPDGGALDFRGLDVFSADAQGLAEYRNRNVGFVFQLHHLLPEFSALENVEMPFRIGRRLAEHADQPARLLERMGLGDRLDHRPGELSGGEQQRVAIARAVVTNPSLVLADEPTGSLDPGTGRKVFSVLQELQRERGFSLVLATHNERLAGQCDRVMRLEEGRLRALDAVQASEYFSGGAGS